MPPDLLYGRTPQERIAQGEAHLHFLRAQILRAPWAHADPYAADHPRDCHGTSPCRVEAKLREQADAYMDAILTERRASTTGTP